MTTPFKPGTRVDRAFALDRAAIDDDARTVSIAFSSETPYDRYWGVEILDHAPESIRLDRLRSKGPLLIDHDNSVRSQVGVIESVEIGADRVGRAVVRFGKDADSDLIYQKVKDGIINNVSVGYVIHDAKPVETKKGDRDTYRITDWEPLECSLVAVPADNSVGVGRSLDQPPQDSIQIPERIIMPEVTLDRAAIEREATDAANKAANQRTADIIAIGEMFKDQGGEKRAAEALRAGKSVDEFRAETLAWAATLPKPAAVSQVGMTDKEARSYSVIRAIRAMVDRDWSNAGLEHEVHVAICKRAGIAESPNGGFYVPYEAQQRDMIVATPTAGGNLVATDLLAGSFIDLLRNRTTVAQLGATMLTGLVGNVAVPKQSGAGTAYWLANEATAITESQMTIAQLPLAPKNVGAYTELSRQLLMQSTPSADALVMNDLARVLALAIDLAALEGTGASGQPTGISATSGIGAVTGTSIDYAKVLEFQTDVAASNALASNCAYVTTPTVAALLMQRHKASNTYSPLWDGGVLDGQVSGFRAMSTNQVTAGSMVFGDFSQVVIGEWGMLELALNPYANFVAAISGIRAIQTVDVGIRHAGAFSRATTIT
jgi:HK97 family phage major capsid protein/HK97 family phage prohead protease